MNRIMNPIIKQCDDVGLKLEPYDKHKLIYSEALKVIDIEEKKREKRM